MWVRRGLRELPSTSRLVQALCGEACMQSKNCRQTTSFQLVLQILAAVVSIHISIFVTSTNAFAELKPFSTERGTVLVEAELQRMFGALGPIEVGPIEKADENSKAIWIWPVYHNAKLVGYGFNTLGIIAIPGFSGRPIEMLVAINVDGSYRDVKIVHHEEPLFVVGYKNESLEAFAEQYNGKQVKARIKVRTPGTRAKRVKGKSYVNGISGATISVVVLNNTIIQSAIEVATQKIKGFTRVSPARVNTQLTETVTWQSLVQDGRIAHQHVTYGEVYKAFEGTSRAFSPVERQQPDHATFSDLWFVQINLPTIGTYLLGKDGYDRLMTRDLKPDENAILVLSNGPYSFVGKDFIPSTTPERLLITQGEFKVELQDTNFYNFLDPAWPKDMPRFTEARIFRIEATEPFDPSNAWTFNLNVIRGRTDFTRGVTRPFPARYHLPGQYFIKQDVLALNAEPATPLWQTLWLDRWEDIALLVAGLLLLTAVILLPKPFTQNARTFWYFRWVYLLYTVGFIGYYAQGQISITHIFTLTQSLFDSAAATSLLFDPIIFILGLYTLLTIVIWGRGFFCGWLCPFGAMQEFAGWLGHKLALPQLRVSWSNHRLANKLKYAIFVGLLVVSAVSLTRAEVLAEIEPFKTALTMQFARSWPYVGYAGGLLIASMFIHKVYCRYICPLGAGLALLGKLRLKDTIPRRDACGSPCQLCSARCEIKAITPTGRIDYDECVQCYECVVIHDDPNQCVPLVLGAKQTLRQSSSKALEV